MVVVAEPVAIRIPFRETFESTDPFMAGVPGPVHGQHGWLASPAEGGMVQGASAYGGNQACSMRDVLLSEAFEDTSSVAWMDFHGRLTFSDTPMSFPSNAVTVFWVNRAGHVVAYSNSAAVVCSGVTVPEGEWVRYTCRCDYAARRWSLWVNARPVFRNFGFRSTGAGHFDGFGFSQDWTSAPSYVDDISVLASTPLPASGALFKLR
jgi:hypothetical protein